MSMNYEEEISDLKRIIANLQQALFTDSLTGLANRVAFYSALETEWKRAARGKTQISIVFMDVDWFKAANQFYGHDGADSILAKIGAVIGSFAKRPGDLAARPMGDEFCLLLPGCDTGAAHKIARDIDNAIRQEKIENLAAPSKIATITAGVDSRVPSKSVTYAAAMKMASKYMMRAKNKKQLQQTQIQAAAEEFA